MGPSAPFESSSEDCCQQHFLGRWGSDNHFCSQHTDRRFQELLDGACLHGTVSGLRIKAMWQPQSLSCWTACGKELDFSSDTAAPAGLVNALHGTLISALVRLYLVFDARAERFASVTSPGFSWLLLLGMRLEVKVRVLEGPRRSVMQCEDTV